MTLQITGAPPVEKPTHVGLTPKAGAGQGASGRVFCGVEPGGGRNWTYSGSGFFQVDTLTATNWASKTLPSNVVTTNGVRVVVPEAGWPGAGKMFLLAFNSSTSRFELYSATLVTGSTQPTWSSVLLTLQANATLIATALRATSAGIFVGEYSGGSDIAAGPNVYRSTDGTNFSTVIDAATTTRHFHGVYEDPYTGDIWVTVGDGFSPYAPEEFVYRSTDGGATFSGVSNLDNAAWQAVGMGFTRDAIWFASDQSLGGGAYYLDRISMTPRWSSVLKHDRVAVPGGHGRSVVDLVTTSASDAITSATAAFTAADVGREISGPNTIPVGTYIDGVTNSTTASLSQNATGSGTGQTATVKDSFFANAYAGAVDPDTGWFYTAANDTSAKGNVLGIFVYTHPGAEPVLWQTIHHATSSSVGNSELLIESGYCWVGRYGPITLPEVS